MIHDDQRSSNRLLGPIPRRKFVATSSMAAMAWSIRPLLGAGLTKSQIGIAQASYAIRWNAETPSQLYPRFRESLDMIDHCQQLEVGGSQLSVGGWTSDYAAKVKKRLNKYGQYLEGSIRLPKEVSDINRFEGEAKAAKEAGIHTIRTVCLSGRRYENFASLESFLEFKRKSIQSLEWAEPVVRKHQIKLAVENHKDWRISEIINIINGLGSEWIGITLDTGNNMALLEDPMAVVEELAPYAFSTHLKDMGVDKYQDGFLLSEVPLGQGVLDLKKVISVIKSANPDIKFNLEMITRDPLKIPCLDPSYWSTLDKVTGSELASMLRIVENRSTAGSLPQVATRTADERLGFEEENNKLCIEYAHSQLGL